MATITAASANRLGHNPVTFIKLGRDQRAGRGVDANPATIAALAARPAQREDKAEGPGAVATITTDRLGANAAAHDEAGIADRDGPTAIAARAAIAGAAADPAAAGTMATAAAPGHGQDPGIARVGDASAIVHGDIAGIAAQTPVTAAADGRAFATMTTSATFAERQNAHRLRRDQTVGTNLDHDIAAIAAHPGRAPGTDKGGFARRSCRAPLAPGHHAKAGIENAAIDRHIDVATIASGATLRSRAEGDLTGIAPVTPETPRRDAGVESFNLAIQRDPDLAGTAALAAATGVESRLAAATAAPSLTLGKNAAWSGQVNETASGGCETDDALGPGTIGVSKSQRFAILGDEDRAPLTAVSARFGLMPPSFGIISIASLAEREHARRGCKDARRLSGRDVDIGAVTAVTTTLLAAPITAVSARGYALDAHIGEHVRITVA